VKLQTVYRQVLGRAPSAKEQEICLRFLANAPDQNTPDAWSQLYQMLFASIDFRYID
jgi:hypothetical protein